MRQFSRIFVRGLLAILPIFLTIYVVVWSFIFLESTLSGVLRAILPSNLYFPGLGLVSLVLVILVTGIALAEIHVEQMFHYLEKRFNRLPVIKLIYGTCKDFLNYMTNHRRKKQFNKVVTVQMQNGGFKLVGFITEEDLNRHNEQLADDDWVAVYLPMGYQIGGYTLLINRKQVEPVNMSFEDAMRFILTAGVASNHEDDTSPPFTPEAGKEAKPSISANPA